MHGSLRLKEDDLEGVHVSEIVTVDLDRITVNEFNPNTMDPATFNALLSDMRQVGVMGVDLILLRPDGEGYEIVDGEHRFRAAKELGWPSLRARVQDLSLEEAMEVNYRKNRERGQLDPYGEGNLFKWWREVKGLKQAEIAWKFGVHETHVSRRIGYAEKVSPEAVKVLRGEDVSVENDPSKSRSGLKVSPSKLELLTQLDAESFFEKYRRILREDEQEDWRLKLNQAQVEAARIIRNDSVTTSKAEKIVEEKRNKLLIDVYRRSGKQDKLKKKSELEAKGITVILEEERDGLKHRFIPQMDGETYPKCLACTTPAVLLRRSQEEPICANGPCWLKVRREIDEERRKRAEETENRLQSARKKVLEADDDGPLRLALFLISLSHRPGYLEEMNLFDWWRPIQGMSPDEVVDWLRRTAVEQVVRPVRPGDRVDTRQMLNWLMDRYGIDREWAFPGEAEPHE